MEKSVEIFLSWGKSWDNVFFDGEWGECFMCWYWWHVFSFENIFMCNGNDGPSVGKLLHRKKLSPLPTARPRERTQERPQLRQKTGSTGRKPPPSLTSRLSLTKRTIVFRRNSATSRSDCSSSSLYAVGSCLQHCLRVGGGILPRSPPHLRWHGDDGREAQAVELLLSLLSSPWTVGSHHLSATPPHRCWLLG